ncbi:MAG TPA: N,N-dimethylformamidase beta subunit family domain-containing protein [Myxococcales bacterium]|nr:N,N-dimethylformamidase beta subunit family domain-containing protein [Myxococcales bacterium]
MPDAGSDGGPDDVDGGTLALRPSPIAEENQRCGDRGWQLDAPSDQIAAYADRTSALPGESVVVHAGAAAATSASWQLYRLGYYDGMLGRKVAEGGPVQVPLWTAAVLDPATGAVSANWPATFSVAVPPQAVTGVYLVKISAPLGQTWATFVVRERARAAGILYTTSTNTYQAYNGWGGTSLYQNTRTDWPLWHAFAVSFDRPYQNHGSGEVLSMDREFITFAEAQGYDLAYVTDADLDADPGLVARRRMVLFQGHSEYWTAAMRDAAERAIGSGINTAFLAANSAYWQVRFQDASRRLLIGYKEFASLDPLAQSDPAHVTTRWRDPPLDRPESGMIGEMFGAWQWVAAPLSVGDPSSWLWKGTGVDPGTVIPGVYANEVDNRGDPGLLPPGVAAIGNALTENHDGQVMAGESTLYTAGSGAKVFSTGSIKWSVALAGAGRWDARIQQATANVFSVFAGDGTLPAPLQPMRLPSGPSAPSYRPQVQVKSVSAAFQAPTSVAAAPGGDAIVVDDDRILRVTPAGAVSLVAGSSDGFADGPCAAALFSGPRGLAVGADGTIYVSDTRNNRIRAISPAGMVRTIAGSRMGFADGVGANALFTWPMAIAVSATGSLLVADTWNQRIREVRLDGTVTTWAGNGLVGLVDGAGATAQLSYPMSLAMLPGGDVLFVEPESGMLRKVSAGLGHEVSRVAGALGAVGWNDGSGGDAMISETIAAAVSPTGEVVLLDGASARIRALRSGVVDTLAGGGGGRLADGAGSDVRFRFPRALAVAPDGSYLVVDVADHALRRITVKP